MTTKDWITKNLPELNQNQATMLEHYIAEREREACADEILDWFELPKHYPGEEYRNKPFAEVKCMTPGRVQYQMLDSRFTYAITHRLKELKSATPVTQQTIKEREE